MATDDPIRASDVDREAVVATLRDAYSAGRLTWDEFDERSSAAYAGKTWGDLRLLTADLPVHPALGSDLPEHMRPDRVAPYYRRPDPVPPAQSASRPLPAPRALPDPEKDADEGRRPARRRRPAALIIPVAVWVLLVAHANDGVTALVVIVFLLAAFATAAFRR
jgi:hypothetical protein